MKKRIISLLLAFVMVIGLTACAGNKAETPASSTPVQEAAQPQTSEPQVTEPEETQNAPATITFTDDCGREVEIPTDITRVVSSGPLSQIVLFAIAPEMFVGLAAEYGDSAKGFIPEEYFDLPYFGQLYGSANLNVEELAAVNPQLIIDIGEAKKSIVEDMDDLEAQTQIPSIHIEASLATMPDAYRKLGSILGKEEKGEELAQFCEKVYNRTVSIMDKVGDNRVNALYVLGEEGLNVLANGSYHAELIDMLTNNLAVVDNPAGKGSGNEVTMEQIALWNPDFILFAPGSIYDTVADQEAWKEITAVKNSNYIEVPEGPHNWMGTPPAVQRYLGLIWLTAELYPEFCDYDVKAEIMEYYELFYGCTLTEEQYDALTANAFTNK